MLVFSMMSGMSLSVDCIWACSILGQLAVLILLFLNGNVRRVPFFIFYIALNLCQGAFLVTLGFVPGLSREAISNMAWVSECLTLLAQALATTEILGITLKLYPGIWGLAWRALAFTSALVVMIVVLTSRGHGLSEMWFEINRGYHLTFATALITCLLLVRYYSIRVPLAYKLILGGFCLNSCIEVLINTILQLLFHKGYLMHQLTWQLLTMISFIATVVIWLVAVRKPFLAENSQIASLSDSAYKRLSPEINEHLRALNEKLMRLWKTEARSH